MPSMLASDPCPHGALSIHSRVVRHNCVRPPANTSTISTSSPDVWTILLASAINRRGRDVNAMKRCLCLDFLSQVQHDFRRIRSQPGAAQSWVAFKASHDWLNVQIVAELHAVCVSLLCRPCSASAVDHQLQRERCPWSCPFLQE